jgi:glycosyltransferase involved in cell wall biosynthesis
MGWQSDLKAIWQAADAALLTSRNEGTPTALIEAMAAGAPFVATNVGAVKDVAIGEMRELPEQMGLQAANGFLTTRTPEALLHCLETLANDEQLARRMAIEGRNFVLERFSTTRLITDLTALYHTLLSEKRGIVSVPVPARSEESSNAADAI